MNLERRQNLIKYQNLTGYQEQMIKDALKMNFFGNLPLDLGKKMSASLKYVGTKVERMFVDDDDDFEDDDDWEDDDDVIEYDNDFEDEDDDDDFEDDDDF